MLAFWMVPLIGQGTQILFAGTGIALGALSSFSRTLHSNDRNHALILRIGTLLLVVVGPVFLSAFVNESTVGMKAGLSFLAMQSVAAMVAFSRSVKSHLSFLSRCMWAFGIILLLILIFGQYSGTHVRLSGIPGMDIHPNYISLLALALGACSVTQKLSVAIAVNLFAGLIVYLCESRTAMVCVIETIFLLGTTAIPRSTTVNYRQIMLLLVVLIVAMFICGIAAWKFNYINDNFLRLDDSHRGLRSGFSGRDRAWEELLGQWETHPIAGAGYMEVRSHLDMPADGGYFVVAAETGIIGLASIGTVFISFLFSIVRTKGLSSRIRLFWLAILVMFATLNVMDSRLQSAANPMTFLFYIAFYSAVGLTGAKSERGIELERRVLWTTAQSPDVKNP